MSDAKAISIAVVDDDPLMIKVLERMLELQAVGAVTSYTRAQDVLSAMDDEQSSPGLMFLDLNMPEMDGVELIRHLVARNFRGHLVLLSGEDERLIQSAERLVQAHQLSILASVQKPLTPEMLAEILSKCKVVQPVNLERSSIYSKHELERALVERQLVNYYQPKVLLENCRVTGVEVLVRWMHPRDGLVMPDQFIPLAEDSGLIDRLAEGVLQQALADSSLWSQQNLQLPLAINISMENLASIEFTDQFSAVVTAAGVLPKDITLEITESRAMSNPTVTLDTLTRLRLKRFVLSIDDFGTGHSSLAQLRDIPFDEFKVDKSFVNGAWADQRIRAMFETSVSLAKQLGMRVVAEGVETENDWNFLRKSGCDCAQGYFIARPMPASEVAGWMNTWRQRVRTELMPDPQVPQEPKQPGTRRSVLIVEDHEFQRRVQTKILRDEGFDVATAIDGLDALNQLRKLRPDLVLIDVDLPGIPGPEIVRRLRATNIFKRTPILMISGNSDKEVIDGCRKAGANGFIIKPFDRKALLEKIQTILSRPK